MRLFCLRFGNQHFITWIFCIGAGTQRTYFEQQTCFFQAFPELLGSFLALHGIYNDPHIFSPCLYQNGIFGCFKKSVYLLYPIIRCLSSKIHFFIGGRVPLLFFVFLRFPINSYKRLHFLPNIPDSRKNRKPTAHFCDYSNPPVPPT